MHLQKLEALKGNVLESIEKIEGVLEETEQNAVSSAECIEQVMDKLEVRRIFCCHMPLHVPVICVLCHTGCIYLSTCRINTLCLTCRYV